MNWTALVPLKTKAERKGRLSTRLAPDARVVLSLMLLDRMTAVLGQVPRIASIVLVADEAPEDWPHDWIVDRNRGLNEELEAARAAIDAGALLVIHPDLPLVAAADVEALLDAAEAAGCAIAPDRHRRGTNALAIIRDGVRFGFGAHSFAHHRAQAGAHAIVVDRDGLALDCDTPDDLDRAIARGFILGQTASSAACGRLRTAPIDR